MQTIGEKLLEARQRQGISIREAADATKVRGEFLDAMESNQFERIGLADVYRRGFLKIYAKYLRLDPERLLGDYVTQVQSRTPQTGVRRGARDLFAGGSSLLEKGGAEEIVENDFTASALGTASRPEADRKKWLLYGSCGVAAAMLLFLVVKLFESPVSPDPATPAQELTLPLHEVTLHVETGSANVVVLQEMPGMDLNQGQGKRIWDGRITRDAPKKFSVQGRMRIDSPLLKNILVEQNGQFSRPRDPNAPALIVNPPSEL